MNVTPTQRGAFFAGVCMWLLLWVALLKSDEIL